LPSQPEDRVRAQIAEAEKLIAAGRGLEAADILGRILLLDPGRDDVVQALERAQATLAEERRRMEGRLDDARRAIEDGDPETARDLLDQVVSRGGDRDRAHALLDRLDDRTGRIDASAPRQWAELAPEDRPHRLRSPLPRQVFVAVWTLVIVTATVGLAFSWEQLVGSLVRNPAPTSSSLAPSGRLPRPRAGDEALAEARRLLERGDPATALEILDGVSPEEPAYPLARELRRQAMVSEQRRDTTR
jgi:FimV-like protein